MTAEEKKIKFQKIISLSKDIKKLIDEINNGMNIVEDTQEIIDVTISDVSFSKGYEARIHLNDSTGFVNLGKVNASIAGNVLYAEKYSNIDGCYVFSLT